jgi:hypothetical protein
MKDAIIIATRTSESWGFQKGDTLKVRNQGVSEGLLVADNLTRPNYGNTSYAILNYSEYKVISVPGERIVREKKIFGITIYREVLMEAK